MARLLLSASALLAALSTPLAGQERIIVPVTINAVERGDAMVTLRNGDVLVRISDMEAAGMGGAMWERALRFSALNDPGARIGEERAISLAALTPFVRYQFDEANLTLSLQVDPRFYTGTVYDLVAQRPKDMTYLSSPSTFINYSVASRGLRDVLFFGETGTSIRGNLLYNSFSRDAEGDFVRNFTNYIVDDVQRLRRWTFGDSIATTDALGGSALVGGVTVSRNFGLDPYFIRYPSLELRGIAQTPSTVDVYVNGVLVQQRTVPPGPFQLRNVPVAAGSGDMRLVVRDAFGNVREQSRDFYYSTGVLAPGMSEYSYTAGLLRDSDPSSLGGYGDPALLAYHRQGITEWLTLGARAEATEGLVSAGVSQSLRTGAGDIDAGIAGSRSQGEGGVAGELAYRYLGRKVSVGGSARLFSDDYTNIALRDQLDRPQRDVTAFTSMIIPRGSVTLQYSTMQTQQREAINRLSLLTSFSFARSTLFTSVARADDSGESRFEYFAGVSLYVGKTTANFSFDANEGRINQTFEVQRPLPTGTGFGYRVQSQNREGGATGVAVGQYHTSFGSYEVSIDPYKADQDPLVNASGGLVYQKGVFIPTRAVQDSFALVRVPGVPNVRVYLSNQLVGRTDASGNLLVPSMLSYYGNSIRIDDRDVPLDYDVRAVERVIAAPFRGGAYVEFPVQQVRTVVGTIVIGGETEIVPEFGNLTVSSDLQSAASPVGRNGEFYLENLAPGPYSAAIEYSAGTCRFTLQVPATAESFVKMGKVVCRP